VGGFGRWGDVWWWGCGGLGSHSLCNGVVVFLGGWSYMGARGSFFVVWRRAPFDEGWWCVHWWPCGQRV